VNSRYTCRGCGCTVIVPSMAVLTDVQKDRTAAPAVPRLSARAGRGGQAPVSAPCKHCGADAREHDRGHDYEAELIGDVLSDISASVDRIVELLELLERRSRD
jgi:hypothetical protein